MIRRRESAGIIPLPTFQIGHGKPRRSAALSTSTASNPAALVTFRIIIITVILLCLIWFCSIIQIATNIGDIHDDPQLVALRPRLNNLNPTASRTWWIREKIHKIQSRLQHAVPLVDPSKADSPLLIITCERAEYLERTLWKVFEYHPAQQMHKNNNAGDIILDNRQQSTIIKEHDMGRIVGSPIIISQDGNNPDVQAVIETYRQLFEMKLGVPLYRIEHTPPTSLVEKPETVDQWDWEDHAWERPYKLLANHYGWALEQLFSGDVYKNDRQLDHNRQIPQPPLPERVIILEEDIEISRDFFSFMNATADLLDADSTLYAVSAFNDNGKEALVADPKRLLRSDFFPGLGWMMPRHAWDGPPHHPRAGFRGEWAPNGFWDDWLREPNIRRGRQIIRPEISRTFHFGNVKGASSGEATMKLSKIQLDTVDVHWNEMDLSYLESSKFAESYWNRVSRARLVESVEEAKSYVARSDVRIIYSDWKKFRYTAEALDIAQDEKAGVPRTAYEGIVEVRYGRGKFFIFLTPPYVNEMAKPTDFGRKAWLKIDKDALLKKLGVSDKTDDGFSFNADFLNEENI